MLKQQPPPKQTVPWLSSPEQPVDVRVFHLCYDEIFSEIQYDRRGREVITEEERKSVAEKRDEVQFDAKVWKCSRAAALKKAEKILSEFNSLKCCDLASGKLWVLLIDDNFYYRSMRYCYYKLARSYQVGFVQVFLDIPLALALRRIERRNARLLNHEGQHRTPGKSAADDLSVVVTGKTVQKMAELLEAPGSDLKTHAWEQWSFHVTVDDSNSSEEKAEQATTFGRLPWNHILAACVWGIPSALEDPEVVLARKMAGEEENRKSVLHSADLLLRKMISEVMANRSNSSKVEKKELAAFLNTTRKRVLDDYKDNRLGVELDSGLAGNSQSEVVTGACKIICGVFSKLIAMEQDSTDEL